MALFDTLGNNDSPLFVGFNPSKGLDNRLALSYLDRKKSLKPNVGTAPSMPELDFSGLGSDVFKEENRALQGRSKVAKAIKNAGGNYAYAQTTDLYKEGMKDINISLSAKNRLENDKKQKDAWVDKLKNENTGDSVYVGDSYKEALLRESDLFDQGTGLTNIKMADLTERVDGKGLDYESRTKNGMSFNGSYSSKEYTDLINSNYSQAKTSYSENKDLGTEKIMSSEPINNIYTIISGTSKYGSKNNIEQIEAAHNVVSDMFSDEQLMSIHGKSYFNAGASYKTKDGYMSASKRKEEYRNKIRNAATEEEKNKLLNEFYQKMDFDFKSYATEKLADEFRKRVDSSQESGFTYAFNKFGEIKPQGSGSGNDSVKMNIWQLIRETAVDPKSMMATKEGKDLLQIAGYDERKSGNVSIVNISDNVTGKQKTKAGSFSYYKNDEIAQTLNDKARKNTDGDVEEKGLDPDQSYYIIGADGTMMEFDSGFINDDGDPTDAYVALGEYTGELYSGNLNTEYDDGSVDSENKNIAARYIYIDADGLTNQQGYRKPGVNKDGEAMPQLDDVSNIWESLEDATKYYGGQIVTRMVDGEYKEVGRFKVGTEITSVNTGTSDDAYQHKKMVDAGYQGKENAPTTSDMGDNIQY